VFYAISPFMCVIQSFAAAKHEKLSAIVRKTLCIIRSKRTHTHTDLQMYMNELTCVAWKAANVSQRPRHCPDTISTNYFDAWSFPST
jgi:hypothetical protein